MSLQLPGSLGPPRSAQAPYPWITWHLTGLALSGPHLHELGFGVISHDSQLGSPVK